MIRFSIGVPATLCRAACLLLAFADVSHSAEPTTETEQQAAPPPTSESSFRVNGFGTLGLAHASRTAPGEFARDSTQAVDERDLKTRTDSRLGLQLNWTLDRQWELVTQGLLQHLPSDAPLSQSINLAFVAFRPTTSTTLRVGRTSPDVFLLADSRNVGFVYPWVRPAPEFYSRMPESLDGADATTTWRDTGMGHWIARAGAGRFRHTAEGFAGNSLKISADNIRYLTVTRENSGLTLKVSHLRSKLTVGSAEEVSAFQQALLSVAALPVQPVAQEAANLANRVSPGRDTQYTSIGAAFDQRPWWIHAEFARATSQVLTYASIGYRIRDVTLYSVWAKAKTTDPVEPTPSWEAQLTPVIGAQAAQQAQALGSAAAQAHNAARTDQRSISFGTRVDLNPQLALKVQWDYIAIGANGSAMWKRASADAARANVVSATLDFIF